MANEKRMIDAYKLENLVRSNSARYHHVDDIVAAIVGQPTVDAVEVVRCKDCVCYEETCPGYGYCYHWDYEQGMSPNQVESDDFCSYGERKDNERID